MKATVICCTFSHYSNNKLYGESEVSAKKNMSVSLNIVTLKLCFVYLFLPTTLGNGCLFSFLYLHHLWFFPISHVGNEQLGIFCDLGGKILRQFCSTYIMSEETPHVWCLSSFSGYHLQLLNKMTEMNNFSLQHSNLFTTDKYLYSMSASLLLPPSHSLLKHFHLATTSPCSLNHLAQDSFPSFVW